MQVWWDLTNKYVGAWVGIGNIGQYTYIHNIYIYDMIFGIRQTSYNKDIWEYYMWILPIIWDIWVCPKTSRRVGNGTWWWLDFAVSFFVQTMVFTAFSDAWIIPNVDNSNTFQDICVFPSGKRKLHHLDPLKTWSVVWEIRVFLHLLTNQAWSVAPFLFSPFCHASVMCPHVFSKFEPSAWINMINLYWRSACGSARERTAA